MEEALVLADVGVPTSQKVFSGLQTVAKQEAWKTTDQAVARFEGRRAFSHPARTRTATRRKPAIVLVVGVNGSGKTTTIGKLATKLRAEGKRVTLVAGDTFRAAAAEQLGIWAERSGSELIRGAEGADPSSVVFDGVRAGVARGADVVLIDTAGRLQTKTNLMEELKKMRRVIEREAGGPPAETLLILDGTTGQNAISQATLFGAAPSSRRGGHQSRTHSVKGGVLLAIVDALEFRLVRRPGRQRQVLESGGYFFINTMLR